MIQLDAKAGFGWDLRVLGAVSGNQLCKLKNVFLLLVFLVVEVKAALWCREIY